MNTQKYRRAGTYKAIQPYLSEPIPMIKLKYFTSFTDEDRIEAMKLSSLICAQCGDKIAVIGSYNSITGKHVCDRCAIDNYWKVEGFKTRSAGEAHRRRLFDLSYLLTEMLTDDYIANFEKTGIDELTDEESEQIMQNSQVIWNGVPLLKKRQLENTASQSKIEGFFLSLMASHMNELYGRS